MQQMRFKKSCMPSCLFSFQPSGRFLSSCLSFKGRERTRSGSLVKGKEERRSGGYIKGFYLFYCLSRAQVPSLAFSEGEVRERIVFLWGQEKEKHGVKE